MTHILHLTRDFPPRWRGGISTAVFGIVQSQQREGHDVTVVSFDGWRPHRRGDVLDALVFEGGNILDEKSVGEAEDSQPRYQIVRCVARNQVEALRTWLQPQHVDVVEVHHPMLWSLLRDLELSKDPRTRYVAHVYASHMDQLRNLEKPTLSAQTERMALYEADVVIAPSEALLEQLRTDHPSRAGALRCRRHTPAFEALSQRIPYEQRRWDLALFGRFSDLKNTDPALDAIANTLREHTSLRAVVVGGLPDNPRTEQKRWRTFLERHAVEVSDRVHFKGWLPHVEAMEIMSDSRVLLAPSKAETWGIVVQEAQRLGVCVVATPIPSHREQITHGETGILSENASADALESALRALHSNPTLPKRIAAAARAKHVLGGDGCRR